MMYSAVEDFYRLSQGVYNERVIERSRRQSNSVVPQVCASAPLGAATSSQGRREILRSFHIHVTLTQPPH
jgi:hypothetical protein